MAEKEMNKKTVLSEGFSFNGFFLIQYFGHFLTVTASLFSDLQPVVFRFFSISA
jgi:hypothetical protein